MRTVPFPRTPAEVRECLALAAEGAIAVERDGSPMMAIVPEELRIEIMNKAPDVQEEYPKLRAFIDHMVTVHTDDKLGQATQLYSLDEASSNSGEAAESEQVSLFNSATGEYELFALSKEQAQNIRKQFRGNPGTRPQQGRKEQPSGSERKR